MHPRSSRPGPGNVARLFAAAVVAPVAWFACMALLTHGAYASGSALASAGAARVGGCPTTADPAAFSPAQLRALSEKEQSYGPRPTASPAHTAFVDWLEESMRQVPGMSVESVRYQTDRWDSRPATFSVGGTELPVAAPIPFTASTGAGGLTAPLVYLPADTSITPANSAGKLVVRDLPTLSVPWLVFFPPVLGFSIYDPDLTINPLEGFAAEAVAQSQVDLESAADAGARGVIELSSLPRSQFAGTYAPYEGVRFRLPGAYLGADEGAALKAAIAAAPGAQRTASLTQRTSSAPAETRTLMATLPGQSDQKIVLDSHTDGMGAVWEAGPVVMLQMARYLASLPIECRPRTLQFAFVTGHLHQVLLSHGEPNAGVRDGGAGQLAIQLDREYDEGKVAGVVVLEHLGLREYEPKPRPGGLPGDELVPTGRSEASFMPVSDSLPLRSLVSEEVREHDLRRTAVLTGVDLIDPTHVPRHCSFGGEGTPFNLHLLPTVSQFALADTLFSPQFGPEAMDFDLMARQSLAFTDIVTRMSAMGKQAIAGQTTLERLQRSLGWPGCPPVPGVEDGGPGLFEPGFDDGLTPAASPAPVVRLTRARRLPGNPKRQRHLRVRFTFAADQPGARFYCAVDRRPFAPCTSPVTVGLKPHPRHHKFRVVAQGAEGNFGPVAVRRYAFVRLRSFENSRQPRVLATSAAVSHARRAVAIP